MTPERKAALALMLARVAVVVAGGLLVVVFVRSVREQPTVSRDPVPDFWTPTSLERSRAESPQDVRRLVARDPFSPLRTAPEVPYRLGSVENSVRTPDVLAGTVRLLGTVVQASGGSFAMCQLGSAPPQMVYRGQRIGALRLESVSQGSAVFIDDAGLRIVLSVPRSGG